jgi:hypothetical protein
LVKEPETVLDLFDATFPTDENITRSALEGFIKENFLEAGEEMIK